MASGLFLGLATVDIFNLVDAHPRPNCKIAARRQLVYAGGPAANAAVAYAALGNASSLCTGLGRHPMAALARDDLIGHGVTLHDCAAEPSRLPIISTILIDAASGNRSVIYSDPQGRRLDPDCAAATLLEGTTILLLDGFFLPEAVMLAAEARRRGIVTVLDGGSWKPGLERLLPHIDYAICSADFKPPGCKTAGEVLSCLDACGVKRCAVSRGHEPILIRADAGIEEVPVPAVAAVDTLGAGDILHGSFCHYIGRSGFSASLQQAAEVASLSCRYVGTRAWIGAKHGS